MNHKGFSQVILLGIIGVIIGVGAGGFLVFTGGKIPFSEKTVRQEASPQQAEEKIQPSKMQSAVKTPESKPQPESKPKGVEVIKKESKNGYWQHWPDHYRPVGNIPLCPEPVVIPLPVERTKITSILYPGQYRGGLHYKPHGGFGLDNLPDNKVAVSIPLDAELIYGSRDIRSGDVQYLLGFRMPCGIEYRLDHLRVLEPKFQKLIDAILPLKVEDSRTTNFSPPIPVKSGDVIAIEVGSLNPLKIGFDFGVYDLRKKNKNAADPEWVKARGSNILSHYAVCWFDWLSPEDEKFIRSLPAGDWASGSKSDLCE